jgi:hypothetical protein
MYKHTCDRAKVAGDEASGITITAKVLANLKPIDDAGRAFWVEEPRDDIFVDGTEVESLWCSDCEEEFATKEVKGRILTEVEWMLHDGGISEVIWSTDYN